MPSVSVISSIVFAGGSKIISFALLMCLSIDMSEKLNNMSELFIENDEKKQYYYSVVLKKR